MENNQYEHETNKYRDQAEKELSLEKTDLSPLDLAALMAKEFPAVEWLVESLIPSGCTVAISGDPASNKTWLILHLATQVALGQVVFDKFSTDQGGVLIVDEESGARLLQNRFKMLTVPPELPIHFLTLTGFKLAEESVGKLITKAEELGVKLVIFDALVRIHNADENDAVKMAGVFHHLKQLNKAGIAVVFTHHNRKSGVNKFSSSQEMRGSSDILASVDIHLAVKKDGDVMIIDQTKNRLDAQLRPFKVNIIKEEDGWSFDYAGEIDEAVTVKTSFQTAIREILASADSPIWKHELFRMAAVSGVVGGYGSFKVAVSEMVKKDPPELFERKGERNKVYLSLTPFEKTESLALEILGSNE